MGKNDRNKKGKKKNGKKHAHNTIKTTANSASNATEAKEDVNEIMEDIQEISERTQADENNMQIEASKSADDEDEKIRSLGYITILFPGEIPYMSDEKIKEHIDSIEKTVALWKLYAEPRKYMTSTRNTVGTNSVLDQFKHLGEVLKLKHREFFANETIVISLNEENMERMWNIFYSSSDKSKQDNETKIKQVLEVLKKVRQMIFPQKKVERHSIEYNGSDEIKENKGKESEILITENTGDVSSSEKEPETSIENAEINENKRADHGNIVGNTATKKNKDMESDLIIKDNKRDVSSEKEPKTSIENAEQNEKNTANCGNIHTDTNTTAMKNEVKKLELIIKEKKGDMSFSEKEPETSIENAKLHEINTTNHGNKDADTATPLKKNKDIESEREIVLTENKEDVSLIKESETSIENAELNEKNTVNRGNKHMYTNTAAMKNEVKKSELITTEKKGDASSEKEPKTSIENAELNEKNTANRGNIHVGTNTTTIKNKVKKSEVIITEKKGDTSFSENKAKTFIGNSEFHEKTAAIANDVNIVANTPVSYYKQNGKVIKLEKNGSINFCCVPDDYMCITAGNNDYFTSEKNDITFNFNDENIQVSFTGNHITISTPDNEFDIDIRKTDVVNLSNEATYTDNV